ncbi:phosphorus acquisition-controlling protein [Emericellopsis atlantica]|uniref:Phosphorus acquisition-controlling protein n=1 Tax=Emericellopsis atlantica TaxID=2614577 RepID=A0A9P7ZT60_9HYPO|nr:phosphorus acquisition-controlling protein [Emericellopsis atlantica]KAG9257800.1 phosphorus acquisition-controlling protein [Emericellopsis atlantica]
MMTSNGWDGQDHHMATAPEDDFGQFLDMSTMGEGMPFDFNGFQDASAQTMMSRPREQHDAIMGDSGTPSMMPQPGDMMHNHTPMSQAGPSHGAQMLATSAPPSDSISTLDAQIQYLQQQKFQQQQRQIQEQRNAYYTAHSHSVPPTPQSLEMPPNSGHFYSQQQQDQVSYDRRYHHQQQQRLKEQDMAFTPLVSPAVTPLDPHFNIDTAFTVPGAYFSPLTSPALHAQNDSGSGYDHSTHSNNSPIEMDLETAQPPVASTLELSKKARKNNAAKTRSKAAIKSSPISKPQRKKAGPSPAIVSHVLSEVEERDASADLNMSLLPAASTDGSEENASVSPENLTDMPPPPLPAWKANKSPYIAPQAAVPPTSAPPTSAPSTTTSPTSQNTPIAAALGDLHTHPATPASLMRLPASQKQKAAPNQPDQMATDNIESLELPESVSRKKFAPIDTHAARASPRIEQEPGSAQSTTSKPQPSPSLRRPGTSSASQSPRILPGGSAARKTPQLAPRTGRKHSTGSVQVSPALLPRISPSIKPLLPGGDLGESDASRLLMSKSNYQNILEGNMVPGVTYPSELSNNLTSKRTSHKIAEQGRRNRINSALQIMAGLLPDNGKSPSGEDSDKKDSKQQNNSNSKASVVEQAIVHLRQLETENGDLKKEVQDLRSQLEKLKSPT